MGALAGFYQSQKTLSKLVDVFMVPFFSDLKPKGQIVTVPGDVGERHRDGCTFQRLDLSTPVPQLGCVCLPLRGTTVGSGVGTATSSLLLPLPVLSIPLQLLLFLTFSFLFPSGFSS